MNNEAIVNNEKNIPRGKAKRFGIRWTLFAFLAMFTGFVLLVVWIFQAFLLSTFYENTKMNEMMLTSSVIEANVTSDTLERSVYSLAEQYSICILVYKIDGSKAVQMVSCDISNGCMIHHLSARSISNLYNKSLASGGEYTETVSLGAFRGHNALKDEATSTIYVKSFKGSDGESYALFLNSDLAPVSATVNVLFYQLKWISAILLVGALVISLIMSKFISTPIIKLNRDVKKLAKGNYEEPFEGKGYREIEELSDALRQASYELSQNDRLQKDLVANISHDLRTPLTMIRGYSEMMRDIPGENTAENAQIVIDETKRLSELVEDVLDLSKIQSGARKLEKETFNFTETVRATLGRYEKLTEKDGYVIKFISNSEVDVFADRTMMLQVVYNLINNAINYTGEDKCVTVKQLVSVDGKKVRFSVTDTGSGIPSDEIENIWDRYYKVDKVHRRATVGTGLGLSIVKSILESHEAIYGVESTMGVGSTFWFELDVAENKNS